MSLFINSKVHLPSSCDGLSYYRTCNVTVDVIAHIFKGLKEER